MAAETRAALSACVESSNPSHALQEDFVITAFTLQGKSYYACKEWYSGGSHHYVIHSLCKVKMIPSHHSVTLVNTELIYQ